MNTASSAAYLVAAGWVVQRRPPRWKLWAAVLAAVGLGSIAYHGPGTPAGKALHDGALLAILPVAASGVRRPNRRLPLAAAIGASSAVLHADHPHRLSRLPSRQPAPGPRRVAPLLGDRPRALGGRRNRPMMRRIIDRLFGLIAIALARGLHKTVAVTSLDAARAKGPRVLVVNHFNGFVDVIVLVAALGRLPRFVAKAGLRKVLPARPFLSLAGVVYVQRVVGRCRAPPRTPTPSRTVGSGCARATASRSSPRGRPTIAKPSRRSRPAPPASPWARPGPVRRGVVVVPVGLSYGDKTKLRNDVLVSGGIPIWVGDEGDEDHAAVRALTERITAGLDALVPGLDDPLDAWALERAAAVAERTSDHEPDLADRRSLARQLARAPEPLRGEVVQAAGSYSLALDVADVDDAAVVGSDAPSVTELVVRAVVTWFVAPLIATIAVVNGPAIGAVVLVDRFVSTPVSKGTIRALVAVVLFPATWITVAVLGTDGALRITALVIGNAIALLAALWLVEGDVAAARRWWRHYRARVASARLPALRIRRAALVETVRAAQQVRDRSASAS